MTKEFESLTLERMEKIAEDRNDRLVRTLVALARLKIEHAIEEIKTGFDLLRPLEFITTGFVNGHNVKVINLVRGDRKDPARHIHYDAFMDKLGRVYIGEPRNNKLYVEIMVTPVILHEYPYGALIQTLNQHVFTIFRAREWEARKKFGDDDTFLFELNLLLDM
jgi:hypothetical protein